VYIKVIKCILKLLKGVIFMLAMMRGYGYNGGVRMGSGISPLGAVLCVFMMLLTIALITIAVIFIVRLIRHGSNPHRMPGGYVHPALVPPALEILNQRLAKGEITVEEYKQLKNEILGQ
jgi:uncharacterized membrane protein